MNDFQLDSDALQESLERARERAPTDYVDTLVDRARLGRGLEPEDMAVLWFSSRVDHKALYELACAARGGCGALETFSPLYLTNTCDAECLMCGMRRDNAALVRQTADLTEIERQLQVLTGRGMYAVALLTGEYKAENRPWAIQYVNAALRRTQDLRFSHVLINVGSIDEDEFETLLSGMERNSDGSVRPKLTMCTFQESYSRETYAKFIGKNPDNPRADFDRRLTNFDRAFQAGMRVANPGILVGLNPDLAFEMSALALHAQHLLALGMDVYLSVPRLRQIAGGRSKGGVRDADFVRLVSLLSLGLPSCKIVITTRESSAIQHKLVPIVTVLSAGSAAVAPYTETGARFPLEASQFEVIDKRPFEDILQPYVSDRGTIANYQPGN